MKLSKEEINLILEALGLKSTTDKPRRNCFFSNEACEEYRTLVGLVTAGFMTFRSIPFTTLDLFQVTDAGKSIIKNFR